MIKKVALVYDAIYPYVKGGGERRVYELGTRLVDAKTEIHLYGMKFWDGPKVIERNGMYLHGIMRARPLYTKDGRRSISQVILFGLASLKLIGAKFDVIDCCGFPYFSMFPAKIAALVRHKPLYATWHEVWGKLYWNEYLGKLGFLGYVVERAASRLPNHIIAVSDSTAKRLKDDLHVKNMITVIPNGIDVAFIQNIMPANLKSDVMYAGRLMDFKHVDMLIEALSLLKKQDQILSCTIIGDGPEKNTLQKLARKLKVSDQIHWLGFLPQSSDVYAHMKSSKVFIFPSEREGFGMVALEANACGLPVLTAAYASNSAKDLIHSKINGEIFGTNAKELAECTMRLLLDYEVYHNKTAKFAQQYDWSNLTRMQHEVYAS